MFEQPTVITKETALKGRTTPIPITEPHFVKGTPLDLSIPEGFEVVILGLGCFWGAERLFWQLEGVESTSVGYSGGFTENPTYKEVCTGQTGHTEVVRIVYAPSIIPLTQLLNQFWENHDPTQGMRQGNDRGTQYRSAIYTSDEEQLKVARESKLRYQQALIQQSRGAITTEIALAQAYYFAETYHQQYLAKNPEGYCGLGGTGVCFPPNL
jgi:peptide-methionine (S)-S-oxide reductase